MSSVAATTATKPTSAPSALRPVCGNQLRMASGRRQTTHSGRPATSSTVSGRAQDIRSRTSRTSVCTTLASMVGSITAPYCSMKWVLKALTSTRTVATGRNTRGQASSESRAAVMPSTTTPKPPSSARRCAGVPASSFTRSHSGRLPTTASQSDSNHTA